MAGKFLGYYHTVCRIFKVFVKPIQQYVLKWIELLHHILDTLREIWFDLIDHDNNTKLDNP